MNPILDIFGNSVFSSTSLTQAINIVPNDYGRIRELGLFADEPIATTSVAVQFANGTLNLLPTRERGAPSSLGMPEKRGVRQFGAFHIPHDDFVRADDVQNIIARTAADQVLEAVMSVVARKEAIMRRKHAITIEHMRMTGKLTMDFDQHTGESIDNFASAVQSVEILMFTRLGEVVMLREYGAGVLELLGRLARPRLLSAFQLLVAAAIDLWEPRFRVRRVLVAGTTDAVRLGRFALSVEADYRPRGHLGDETVESVRSFSIDFATGRAFA